MAYYLSKYVGKYRVQAHVDKNTNDFPRDENGNLEQNDAYIDCRKGQIYHYGGSTLAAYVDSIGTGHNVLKSIASDFGIEEKSYTTYTGKETKIYDYDKLYSLLEKSNVVFNVEETDSEVIWQFKDKYTDMMVEKLIPKTSGASRSPYSSKNLKKRKYIIPKDDMDKYDEAIERFVTHEEDMTVYREIYKHTKQFIEKEIPKKNKKYKKVDMTALMKKHRLKARDFIHELGHWDEFIDYLKKV